MIGIQQDTSWINSVKKHQKCPHCKNGKLDTRVKRGFLVKNFFTWVGTKRYQCNSCGKKSYLKEN